MDCSTVGFPVHHQLLELAQTHVHWVGDVIQPSHPLSSPSPPAFTLSQLQGLFQWVSLWPLTIGLPRWLSGKESTCQCTIHRRFRFDPSVGKIPWRRKWQPTLVFLPGESHGQRSLVVYSPWGHKWVRHDWTTKQQQHEQYGQIEQNNKESSIFLFFPNISSFTTYKHTRTYVCVCLCMHHTAIATFRITVEFKQEEAFVCT